MKKQNYWFKVTFGKWIDDEFDPDVSFMYVAAWDAAHAGQKADKQADSGEIVINVEFLGYPQL